MKKIKLLLIVTNIYIYIQIIDEKIKRTLVSNSYKYSKKKIQIYIISKLKKYSNIFNIEKFKLKIFKRQRNSKIKIFINNLIKKKIIYDKYNK